jgi:deoxyribodipyrimidine photo-lyase
MSTNKTTHIHWFGNDLRVADQPFAKFANEADDMIALYVIDPKRFAFNEWGFRNMSLYRLQSLREHLVDLEKGLAKFGVPLIVKYGKPANVIPQIVEESRASLSFMNEYATHERQAQEQILQILGDQVLRYDGNFLFHPENIDWGDEFPHSFSKFRKKAEKFLKSYPYKLNPALKRFDKSVTPKLKSSRRKHDDRSATPFEGGESFGIARLNEYLFKTKQVSSYKETRNGLLGKGYSTKFSLWLGVGALSPVMIMKELKAYEEQEGKNKSTYWIFFELLWRDLFRHACMFYEDQFFAKSGLQNVKWTNNESELAFKEWVDGSSNNDFVNANMVELKETGFMSNRGRQNVASYFVHEQGQDWRKGAAWFEHCLLDYDVYSNHGNWAYVSGVAFNPKGGSKFNIDFQADRYDNEIAYRNVWLKQ